MKKFLVGLIFVSNLAFAKGTILLGIGSQDNLAGSAQGTTTTNYNLKIIKDVTPIWSADFMINNGKNNSTSKLGSQYEVGLRYSYNIDDDIKVYLRGELGVLQISGLSSRSYAGLEPGVILRPASGPLTIKTDYSLIKGMNTDTLDLTMTRLQFGYDITKENTIAIRKDWMRGDIQTNTWWLFFGHRF